MSLVFKKLEKSNVVKNNGGLLLQMLAEKLASDGSGGGGSLTIETLSSELPIQYYNMGCGVLGTNAYLFGGYQKGGSRIDKIYKFDVTTETTTTLSARLPNETSNIGCGVVETNIYLFGGYLGGNSSGRSNIICKFDTISETITTLTATLPKTVQDVGTAVIGDIIILFAEGSIYRFNTGLETIEDLNITCASNLSSATIGTNVYLFGDGTKKIYSYDSISNKLTTLAETLPDSIKTPRVITAGTNVYLLGVTIGYSCKDKIFKFDSVNKTSELLEVVLPYAMSNFGVATIGKIAYLFGGVTSSNTYLKTILKVSNL